MFDKSRQSEKGFTLIELLMVIAIIGILSAIAIPAYSKYLDKAKISAAVCTLDIARKEIENYYNTYNNYPTAINFVTGQDESGRAVFSPATTKEIQDNFFIVSSYLQAENNYTLTAQSNDSSHTVITMTSTQTTY